MDPVNIPAKFEKFVALPVPEIIGGTQKNLSTYIWVPDFL